MQKKGATIQDIVGKYKS